LLGEAASARRSGQGLDAATPRASPQMQDAKLASRREAPPLRRRTSARRTLTLERRVDREKARPKGVDGAAVLKALRAEIASLQKKLAEACRASARAVVPPLGVVAAGLMFC